MANIRSSWGQWVLALLALAGVGISIYLTAVHYNGAPLACSTGGLFNCERVLGSSFSVVPGTQIPISIPGLLWFLALGAIAGIVLFKPAFRLARQAQLVWTGLGMLTVFYLVYVEIVRLDAFCLWCTILHVIIFASLLLSLTQLRIPQEDDEEFDDDDEEKPAPTSKKQKISL